MGYINDYLLDSIKTYSKNVGISEERQHKMSTTVQKLIEDSLLEKIILKLKLDILFGNHEEEAKNLLINTGFQVFAHYCKKLENQITTLHDRLFRVTGIHAKSLRRFKINHKQIRQEIEKFMREPVECVCEREQQEREKEEAAKRAADKMQKAKEAEDARKQKARDAEEARKQAEREAEEARKQKAIEAERLKKQKESERSRRLRAKQSQLRSMQPTHSMLRRLRQFRQLQQNLALYEKSIMSMQMNRPNYLFPKPEAGLRNQYMGHQLMNKCH